MIVSLVISGTPISNYEKVIELFNNKQQEIHTKKKIQKSKQSNILAKNKENMLSNLRLTKSLKKKSVL